eukprot:CAMPEP_0194216704 /NCGR_PEP_ID=MMETSP0156-20130528/19518_1 /TAXON_ID=33649 /ORGANISM="Thalassionema nitzschioides, Strain L26-B" /LENGTH=250 /DNA_ID=CAMNT_0038945533 /DNA_START=140 /DNA_END=889 /DNA_ORIENTATION=+
MDIDDSRWTYQERFILEKVGFILDLRSPSERDESRSKSWIASSSHRATMVIDRSECHLLDRGHRFVARIDILSPRSLMEYIELNWLRTKEESKNYYRKTFESDRKLHKLCVEALNERGLSGLNEAILESGKEELCRALQTITNYLELNPNENVLIHCVQGKDRTGMLVMLLQVILDVSDEEILVDYLLSNQVKEESAAAERIARKRGRLHIKTFSGTNQEAMVITLSFLRAKYGSISPGYLNSIGFDEMW